MRMLPIGETKRQLKGCRSTNMAEQLTSPPTYPNQSRFLIEHHTANDMSLIPLELIQSNHDVT